MNKEEQEIIESTKEFAKAHNIHYGQMTENMILNAMREQLLLHNVSQQRELLVWLQKSDLVTFPKDEINEVIDDYRFYQTNCG